MNTAPATEELLERLYLTANEGRTEGPRAAEPETVQDAREKGWVEADGGTLRLTEAGTAKGRDVLRRHRLAEHLLHTVLRAARETMHEDACEFEHILRHGLDERICTLLGHPRQCPHGYPIPEGECCRRARQDLIREVAPLCDGQTGHAGTVAYLSTRESREVQKLMAMGILPGVSIRLLRRFPSYVFQVGYSQFTVDRELAEKIYVHWTAG